jgi:hypothetical protein
MAKRLASDAYGDNGLYVGDARTAHRLDENVLQSRRLQEWRNDRWMQLRTVLIALRSICAELPVELHEIIRRLIVECSIGRRVVLVIKHDRNRYQRISLWVTLSPDYDAVLRQLQTAYIGAGVARVRDFRCSVLSVYGGSEWEFSNQQNLLDWIRSGSEAGTRMSLSCWVAR